MLVASWCWTFYVAPGCVHPDCGETRQFRLFPEFRDSSVTDLAVLLAPFSPRHLPQSNDNRLARVISGRSGRFRDAVAGCAPLPPAAATLGLEFVAADVENGTIEVAFAATESFTTPMGDVLGGFLAAMLYDTVGPALLATQEPGQFIATLDLKASFLRAAFPGRLVGRGRVVHREGDIAFLEASLTNSDEAVVATARVIAIDPARS